MSLLSKASVHDGVAVRDMSKLTLEQVEYEYNLAYEILNGTYIDGQLIVPGMLNVQTPNVEQGMHDRAVAVWKLRLQAAYSELVERQILS